LFNWFPLLNNMIISNYSALRSTFIVII
jgi:hypothetical protein